MTRARVLAVVQWALVCAVVFFATPPQRSTPLRVMAVGTFLFVAGWVSTRTVVGDRVAPVLRTAPIELAPPGARAVRLARLETSLTYATSSAGQFHRTVAPLLRELVSERLRRRHGVDIEQSPAAARAIIGEELWQLFEVDRPTHRDGPGPAPAQLAQLVAAVEGV